MLDADRGQPRDDVASLDDDVVVLPIEPRPRRFDRLDPLPSRGQPCPQIGKFPEMVQAGINVSIGTDGNNASNYSDLMRATYLVAGLFKDGRQDPQMFPAEKAYEMATLGGARTLLLEDQIGSLEPGKKADLVLHDGVVHTLAEPPKLKKQEKHTIEVVVDRLTVKESAKRRLTDSVETALNLADGNRARQSWVEVTLFAEGRYGVQFPAVLPVSTRPPPTAPSSNMNTSDPIAIFRTMLPLANFRNAHTTNPMTTKPASSVVTRCENSMTVLSSGAEGIASPWHVIQCCPQPSPE